MMRLTQRILEAIAEMSATVEAGSVVDYQGNSGPEEREAYEAALDAGIWANYQIQKRHSKKMQKRRAH